MPSLDMSTLIPGMNPSGNNVGLGGAPTSSPSMGGNTNPFLPTFAAGQNTPSSSNPLYGNIPKTGPDANMGGGGGGTVPMSGSPASLTTGTGGFDLNTFLQQISQQGFGANGVAPGFNTSPATAGGGGGAPGGGAGGAGNFAASLGFGGGGGNWAPNQNDFVKAMHKAGISAGDAALLYNFLASGAGFNQDSINSQLNAIFKAQQPGINRGEAQLMEQFGAEGLGMSSPAAIGFGDFLSQVSLGQGEIAANLEAAEQQQAVQNYLSVLMAGKGQPPQNMFQNLMQFVTTMSGAALNSATAASKV